MHSPESAAAHVPGGNHGLDGPDRARSDARSAACLRDRGEHAQQSNELEPGIDVGGNGALRRRSSDGRRGRSEPQERSCRQGDACPPRHQRVVAFAIASHEPSGKSEAIAAMTPSARSRSPHRQACRRRGSSPASACSTGESRAISKRLVDSCCSGGPAAWRVSTRLPHPARSTSYRFGRARLPDEPHDQSPNA